MRRGAGIALGIVATVLGVVGLGFFDLAGLGWAGRFFTRIYWDESESGIGVALGVVCLLGWLGLLLVSVLILRTRARTPSRGDRMLAVALPVLSAVVLVIIWALLIARAEPPSEFPTPPWNRA